MRKILEIPQINENDIDKVSKVIDIIANNLDKDCRNELNELQSLTGKSHSVEEFAEYWGWTDLHSLARITLMLEPLHRRLICLVNMFCIPSARLCGEH